MLADPSVPSVVDEARMQRVTFAHDPQCFRVAAVFRAVERSPYLAALIARAGGYYMATWSFFAAVQLLATSPGGGDFGRFFADGAEQEGWTSATFDADLEQLCRSHEDQVVALVRDRRCQMNEVNRCAAALVPALAFVHAHVDNRPVALIEVGASAGLQLLFDRYRYEYVTSVPVPAEHALEVGESTFTWVPPGPRDDVTLRCRVTGESFPDPAAVSGLVASRTGIDLDPPRLDDPDTREWIVASAAMRRGLSAHLIDVVRDSGVRVVAADAVEVIEQMIAEVPESWLPVVYDSASLMYLDADRVAQFRAALARAGQQREVVWISNEAMRVAEDGSVQTVQGASVADDVAEGPRTGAFQFAVELSVVGPADGSPGGAGRPGAAAGSTFDSQLLAVAHPWGLWVDWRAAFG